MLEAEIEERAFTESFYCIIDGKNKKEAVIVNTHTDGTNCVEENGPIALLQLMKNLKGKELERTHILFLQRVISACLILRISVRERFSRRPDGLQCTVNYGTVRESISSALPI